MIPDALSAWIHVAGRLLFAGFLIVFGLRQVIATETVVRFFAAKGVPGPRPVSVVTGLMILLGGVFVVLGWHRFVGAGLIFLALFPAGWALHRFWSEPDSAAQQNDLAHFLKTLALVGGALFLGFYAGDPWPLSLGE